FGGSLLIRSPSVGPRRQRTQPLACSRMAILLPVGTRKGLFLIRGDDRLQDWEVEGPLLPGWSVYHAVLDPGKGALYACTNNWVYGGSFHRSDDLGKSCERAEVLCLQDYSVLKLTSTWHVDPGGDMS